MPRAAVRRAELRASLGGFEPPSAAPDRNRLAKRAIEASALSTTPTDFRSALEFGVPVRLLDLRVEFSGALGQLISLMVQRRHVERRRERTSERE